MSNYLNALNDSIRDGACFLLNQGDNAVRFFNEISPVDAPNAPRYWLPKLCDEDPGNYTPPTAPFEGGQCPGVDYTVTVDVTRINSFCSQVSSQYSSSGFIGPITSVDLRDPFRIGQCPAGDPNSRLTVTHSPGGVTTESTLEAFGTTAPFEITNIAIARTDGQPDTCGNPEPDIPPWPPAGDTYNISPTYIDNSDNSVNLSGNVVLFAPVFAPFVPVKVFAPIRVDLGGVVIDGTIEFAPDFTVNLGAPSGDNSPGNPDGNPDDEDPTGVPTTPDDEDNRRLLGLFVRSVSDGTDKATRVAQSNGPDLFVPRLAQVYFRVRAGRTVGWSGPFDVNTQSQWVPAPRNAIATTARTHWLGGWSGTQTLIYGDVSAVD